MGVAEIVVGGLTTLVGGIGGGLLAGWYQDRRDRRDRPQLKLGFDAKADRIEAAWEGDWPFNGTIFRASLRNEGVTSALNCRVFLTNLTEIQRSGTTQTGFKDSRQVCWVGWNFDARAVPREVTFHVDFVRISKVPPLGWKFTFERPTEEDNALRSYRGTYRFHLVAVSDNAQPAYLNVDVDYQGDHKNLRAWKPSE